MTGDDPASTTARGRVAEDAVADHLVRHGLEVIDRNVCAAGGEVDLIAREGEPPTYVFAEVRSRATAAHGSPLETVGRAKQRRIIRAATAWLVARDLWERVEVRFDVVAVVGGEILTWVRGAFEANGSP